MSPLVQVEGAQAVIYRGQQRGIGKTGLQRAQLPTQTPGEEGTEGTQPQEGLQAETPAGECPQDFFLDRGPLVTAPPPGQSSGSGAPELLTQPPERPTSRPTSSPALLLPSHTSIQLKVHPDLSDPAPALTTTPAHNNPSTSSQGSF